MKEEKPKKDALVPMPVSPLPDLPGWLSLNRRKQDELLEHDSNIRQFRHMQRLGEFGELIELTQVQQLLDGEEMKMNDYLHMIYPQHHDRTILRKQQAYLEMAATIPNPVLKRIAAATGDVLGKFDRIATAAMGDILNAVREMPLLPVNTDKQAEKFMEELNGKLAEERKARRKKGLHKEKGVAEKMATNAIIHYMRESGLKTSAEKRQFLQRVIGWVMEAQAVAGTLRAGRITIPDGILIRRGTAPEAPPGEGGLTWRKYQNCTMSPKWRQRWPSTRCCITCTSARSRMSRKSANGFLASLSG